MAWLQLNQQAQNCFACLGHRVGDTYVPSPECFSVLAEINKQLCSEDRLQHSFRRTIGFSEALKKDLIPLLVSAKDHDVIGSTIRILVNLSVPVECLVPTELMSRTDSGRMAVFELDSFLINSKDSFVEPKTTRAIVDFMKKIIEAEEKDKLSEEDCEGINNCLLLLRNVLHIPESRNSLHLHPNSSTQNQIVWNLFIQNIDKVLIHLMNSEQRTYWGVSMVQLIAVMYKNQHVGTLQKLLNVWVEGSLSESSEDNESNTSPPDQGSASDSSPMLTSDSSDGGRTTHNQGGSSGVPHLVHRKNNNSSNNNNDNNLINESSKTATKMLAFEEPVTERKPSAGNARHGKSHNSKTNSSNSRRGSDHESGVCSSSEMSVGSKGSSSRSKAAGSAEAAKWDCFSQDMSDCGYATQMDNPEQMSTSSNEEEAPQAKRPVHQKHHMQKTRFCSGKQQQQVTQQEKKDMRRKKLVKRSKTTIMNMKAMAHHLPTDEDISHILKEFTVDFLLKAYGPLVKVLHSQLLASHNLARVDTSHFFWLVTYFLKFASQLELDLEHLRDVLSFDILSYLTYEAVSICETLQISARQQKHDMKPCLRRQHLVVTAIREFLHAVDTYRKVAHLTTEDRQFLQTLQRQIVCTDDLKCVFVLLLRQYDPAIHNKQYLQDVIVTNHSLLLFIDSSKDSSHVGLSMMEHIKQFASADVMRQYGLLLEDFQVNGEFVNDCVFTMMHHVGGDLNQVDSLFQPSILKTFTQMWEGDFELCDDWSDLIEYVIHKFTSLPQRCLLAGSTAPVTPVEDFGWSKEECENLHWYFHQSSTNSDPISNIVKLYRDDGVSKTRIAVIRRLLEQEVISEKHSQSLLSSETLAGSDVLSLPTPRLHKPIADEIDQLRELLVKDERGAQLASLQRLLMETCYVKLMREADNSHQQNQQQCNAVAEPIPQYYSYLNQSIPVVAWNSDQNAVILQQPFQLLLHKLGFHLPADTGKVYPRIPSFWTVEVLYSVAQKLGPIDVSKLKFDLSEVTGRGSEMKKPEALSPQHGPEEPDGHAFLVPRCKHTQMQLKYTPLPNAGSSWLDIVKASKPTLEPNFISGRVKECEVEEADMVSVCSSVCGETSRESVASDLTRMCVSDEDETATKN